MDNKDKEIIRALQRDGRMANSDIAKEVSLSPSPCLRRIKNLEKRGDIIGYSAIVNAKEYGLAVTAFVRVSLERHSSDVVQHFEHEVNRLELVLDCYVITGKFDYLLRVLLSNLEAYEHFVKNQLQTIGGIRSIDTSFAYSTIKQSKVFPKV